MNLPHLTAKTLAAWEETPIPIAFVGNLKRQILSLCRDGLEWRRAKKVLRGEANLRAYIKAAELPKEGANETL